MIRQIEGQLQDLIATSRRRHPALPIFPWSHSVAALTRDAWSFGFTLDGLAAPLDFELVVVDVHSAKPALERARADWRKPGFLGEWLILDLIRETALEPQEPPGLDGWTRVRTGIENAPIPAPNALLSMVGDRLVASIDRAVRSGPRREVSTMVLRVPSKASGPDPELLPLTESETTVLRAWSAHLRSQGYSPLQLSATAGLGGFLYPFHAHFAGQARQIAANLAEVPEPEALVQAFLAEPFPKPEDWLAEVSADFDWRNFYRLHPGGHGWMAVDRPGVAGDRAALFAWNTVGYGPPASRAENRVSSRELNRVSRLTDGPHLAVFHRFGAEWKVRELHRFSWERLLELAVEVAVALHYDGRVQVVERAPQRFRLLWEGREFLLLDRGLLQNHPSFASPLPVVVTDFSPASVVRAVAKLLERWRAD